MAQAQDEAAKGPRQAEQNEASKVQKHGSQASGRMRETVSGVSISVLAEVHESGMHGGAIDAFARGGQSAVGASVGGLA